MTRGPGNDDPHGADEAPLPSPISLCPRCAAHRSVETRTSRFLLCTALPVKYPRQPVSACLAYLQIPPHVKE